LARLDHHDGGYEENDEDGDGDSPSRHAMVTHATSVRHCRGVVNKPSEMCWTRALRAGERIRHDERVEVLITIAPEREKSVLRRLLELNSHDFSAIDGRDLGPHGEYGYPYLDHYWDPSESRHPFLITVDGEIAGCALVRAGSPHEFGEFFIVRKYRRRGVGTSAARSVLALFPGEWLVREIRGNDDAVAFWRLSIPYEFREMEDDHGTGQLFVVPA